MFVFFFFYLGEVRSSQAATSLRRRSMSVHAGGVCAVSSSLTGRFGLRCHSINKSILIVSASVALLTRPSREVTSRGQVSNASAAAVPCYDSYLQIGVLVGNCDGFVGNRMLKSYADECSFMVEDGASPAEVDRVVKTFGMGLGPFEMTDLAGTDISYLIRCVCFLLLLRMYFY